MRKYNVIFGIVLGLLFHFSAQAGLYEQLNAAQQKALQNGDQVMVTEEVAQSAWPRVTIFERVDATPEEAAAVFFDYELQKQYLSDMDSVIVRSRPTKTSALVDYEMSIFFFTIRYTLEQKLSTYDKGAGYRFDWKMVKGDKMKDIQGTIQIEKLGNASILMYRNLVVPTTTNFRDRAITQTRDSAAALRDQIEVAKSDSPEWLAEQVTAIRDALTVRSFWEWIWG